MLGLAGLIGAGKWHDGGRRRRGVTVSACACKNEFGSTPPGVELLGRPSLPPSEGRPLFSQTSRYRWSLSTAWRRDLSSAFVVRQHSDVSVDAGPLQTLLDAPSTTDVLVNGGAVWVDSGCGLERVPLDLGGEERVRALAVRLAASVGRRLDAASPFVDARLGGDIRLHAVLPPIAREGTCVSLRVLRPRTEPLSTLVGSVELADVLRKLVAARLSFLVTGGTGVGKTTILSALLGCADPDGSRGRGRRLE